MCKVRLIPFLLVLLLALRNLGLSQWSAPVLIDSSNQVPFPQIAVSATNQIAVVSFHNIYISTDLGKSFKKTYVFNPDVQPSHLFYPGGLAYDGNGTLWVLWSWDECSDDDCTFSLDYWVYLSKSTDGGTTFDHVIKQRRALALVSNGPDPPMLRVGRDNTVHFLYDSLPRLGETYRLGNQLTYCRLPNGDTTNRLDARLPSISDSLEFLGAGFSIGPTGRIHVTASVAVTSIQSQVRYTHIMFDGSFAPYIPLDSIHQGRQGGAFHLLQRDSLTLAYFVGGDPFDTSSLNHFYARSSNDDGNIFGNPREVFVASGSIAAVDSVHLYSIRSSITQGGLVCYTHPDLALSATDSSLVGNYFYPQMAINDSGGKFIVMNDNNWNAYCIHKDVIMSVTDSPAGIVADARLGAYPNPFNSAAVLSVSIPERGEVRLALFDILGRIVRTVAKGTLEAGFHEYHIDAGNLASGTYLLRLIYRGKAITEKVSLMK